MPVKEPAQARVPVRRILLWSERSQLHLHIIRSFDQLPHINARGSHRKQAYICDGRISAAHRLRKIKKIIPFFLTKPPQGTARRPGRDHALRRRSSVPAVHVLPQNPERGSRFQRFEILRDTVDVKVPAVKLLQHFPKRAGMQRIPGIDDIASAPVCNTLNDRSCRVIGTSDADQHKSVRAHPDLRRLFPDPLQLPLSGTDTGVEPAKAVFIRGIAPLRLCKK